MEWSPCEDYPLRRKARHPQSTFSASTMSMARFSTPPPLESPSSPPRTHKKKLEKIEVGYVGREENNESWPQAGPLLLFPRWID